MSDRDPYAMLYRARQQTRSWLHEFDCWIVLCHDEEQAWEAVGQWAKSAASANARTRTIKVWRGIGCGIEALALMAHEIGHIVLNHRGRRPAYVQEYEAERFARKLLKRDGYHMPRSLIEHGRAYVREHIERGLSHGLRAVDPKIARWARWPS